MIMKIGIYPGSFNPIHKAHIGLSNYCLEKKLIDKIILVPLDSYWDKEVAVSLENRINMLKLYENDKIIIEENSSGLYSYQIIDKLTNCFPDAEIYYMIGADNLENIHKWKNLSKVMKHKFIVFKRGNCNVEALLEKQKLDKTKFTIINNTFKINISSTEIRERIAACLDTSKLLDKKARDYINKYNLYGGKTMFDAEKETYRIIEFIKNYYAKYNCKGAVLGISGGKDSAVVAGLFSKALGSENVIGLTLPCHSASIDKKDAKIVSKHFGFELFNIDLTPVFNTFKKEFKKGFRKLPFTDEMLENSDINAKPRLRMMANYYIGAAFKEWKKQGYLVAGTSNADELFTGYFTKGGDNVNDISVLGDLSVDEVIAIGNYIGVPKTVLYKTPHDGLSKKSDEEKLGVLYSDVKKVRNGDPISEDIKKDIMQLHVNSLHKFSIPTYKKEVKDKKI